MNRLLVALDTTDNSVFVLGRAIELAQLLGGKLHLLSVVQMPPFVSAPFVGPSYVNPSGGIAEAEAMLREREREIPPELRDGVVVEEGIVSDVVCSVARSYDADLVVIGAHRHGLLTRMLGTTAATIVNHIDRAVMVVRPALAAREESGPDLPAPAALRRTEER